MAELFSGVLLSRLLVGCICLIMISTVLDGSSLGCLSFFIKQGLSVGNSLVFRRGGSRSAPRSGC
jgi:putative MFS transporter